NFVGDYMILIKNNAAGVVREDRNAKIALSTSRSRSGTGLRFARFLFADDLGRAFYIVLEYAVFNIVHGVGKNGVLAVFAPGLRQSFQFNVRGLPADFIKVVADG